MTDEISPYKPKSIVLFGDSITQRGYQNVMNGWVSGLANEYIRKMDVVNRGFSGYNTRNCLPLFPRVLSAFESDSIELITVFLGANDAALPDFAQHVPLDEYVRNLETVYASVVFTHVHPSSLMSQRISIPMPD